MTRTATPIFCLAAIAVLTIVLCTLTGPAGFGFISPAPGSADIIRDIRLPRVLAAFFVGASLAIASASCTNTFKGILVLMDGKTIPPE